MATCKDCLHIEHCSTKGNNVRYFELIGCVNVEYNCMAFESKTKHPLCDFCSQFDFSDACADVDRHGAHIRLAAASYRYPIEKQFNFCPVCGRPVKKG